MLIFYRKSLEENIEKFIEDIRKASKNLDKENQKFIEDIFLEKKDGTKYTYYASYLRATLKQVLLSKKDVKLNDIFPKNIYRKNKAKTINKYLKYFHYKHQHMMCFIKVNLFYKKVFNFF